MQPVFNASMNTQIKQSCIREIKKAIRDKSAILFVEYSGYSPTIPLLTKIVEDANYKRAYHVIKHNNNGGREVTEFLNKHHLPKMNMRIAGVNTSYCVKETVVGIKHYLPNSNIKVIADACACGWGGHKEALRYMKQLSGVNIIRSK